MSRTRLIKPALFENEILGQMQGDTVLCFAGLWCLADREGRLEDRPMRIKAKLFPYREVNVEETLEQLSKGGFIIRYQIEKEGFIQIINFLKHQHPHRAEQASVIPSLENLPTKDGTSTDQGQSKDSSSRALTLNLIPLTNTLTLNPSSPNGDTGDGHDYMVRLRGLFKMRESTPFDPATLTALKKAKSILIDTTETEWTALEWLYSQPRGKGQPGEYVRKSPATLLNNWNGSVTKALEAFTKAQKEEESTHGI